MKRLIYILLLLATAITGIAEQRPMAFLKAQYTDWHKIADKNEEKPYTSEHKFVLQIGGGASYYYDPQTFYVDSLENDPTGNAILRQAMADALKEYRRTGADAFAIMREKGLMAESRYKNLKNFSDKTITVWESN